MWTAELNCWLRVTAYCDFIRCTYRIYFSKMICLFLIQLWCACIKFCLSVQPNSHIVQWRCAKRTGTASSERSLSGIFLEWTAGITSSHSENWAQAGGKLDCNPRNRLTNKTSESIVPTVQYWQNSTGNRTFLSSNLSIVCLSINSQATVASSKSQTQTSF